MKKVKEAESTQNCVEEVKTTNQEAAEECSINKWEMIEKIAETIRERKGNNTTVYRGPGFISLLTLLLVGLKLTGYIGCSWWVVFAPILITSGIAILTVILIICGMLYMLRNVDN